MEDKRREGHGFVSFKEEVPFETYIEEEVESGQWKIVKRQAH